MTRLKLGRQFKEEEQEYVQIYDKQNDQLMWDVWDKKADWFLTWWKHLIEENLTYPWIHEIKEPLSRVKERKSKKKKWWDGLEC